MVVGIPLLTQCSNFLNDVGKTICMVPIVSLGVVVAAMLDVFGNVVMFCLIVGVFSC